MLVFRQIEFANKIIIQYLRKHSHSRNPADIEGTTLAPSIIHRQYNWA